MKRRFMVGVIFFAALSCATANAVVVPAEAATDAVKLLKEGNLRYVTGKAQCPNNSMARREETTANGQKPFAVIIACSDSRVPVEEIFDRGIGDIFVVRVAGNVISVDETGSVEYAVEHLHTPLVVVMGHTECGAVTAAVNGAEAAGDLKALIAKIGPSVEKARKENPHLNGMPFVTAAIKMNIRDGIAALKASPAIKELVDAGKVQIAGVLYDIYTGEIEWLE